MSDPKYIGIVGHEAAKFYPPQQREARELIRFLLQRYPDSVVVSGGCHLGGIDIWAEEEADKLGLGKRIFKPAVLTWHGGEGVMGFRERNIAIARHSDEVHCIVVAGYPERYEGMQFDTCYHCHTDTHVKSGGCWTAHYAKRKFKKEAEWWII